jgi:hypothetical protein
VTQLALSLVFIFPSLGIVYKYFSFPGTCLYSLTVITGVLVFSRRLAYLLQKKVSRRQACALMALTLVMLAVLFFALYPAVNTDIPGHGADRDEDLTIATSRLLSGQYPYYAKTYLGNSITHFPGSLFLAAPFVLLGNGAYQNFFWLALFLVVASIYFKDTRLALLLFWQIIIFSPQLTYELITGGDLISNSIYPLVFVFLLIKLLQNPDQPYGWMRVWAACAFGVSLSSRSTFLFLLPVLFSLLYQNFKFKQAFKWSGVVFVSYLAVTAPFYLYDPAGFSPLYGQLAKLSQFPNAPAFMAPAVLLLAVLVTGALSFQRMSLDLRVFFRNCCLTGVVLILPVVLASSLAGDRHKLIFSTYGLNFLFFGVLAFSPFNKLFDKHL